MTAGLFTEINNLGNFLQETKMDLNEEFKPDLKGFITMVKGLLPYKKDNYPTFFEEPRKEKITKLSDVHAEAKNVFPSCFVGAKVVVLREFMDRIKIMQQYNFGKQKEPYRCFSQVLDKEMVPQRDDKVIVDPAGSITASYSETIANGYEMVLTSKIKDLVSSETELSFEKETDCTVASITCSMKDVDPNNTKMVTHWMYKIRPDFSFGTEVSFKPLGFPLTPDYSISARYTKPSFVLSTTASKTGFQICVFKQFGPGLKLASIVTEAMNRGPTTLGLALHKSYLNGSEMKIFVDTQKCGGFTFQKDVYFDGEMAQERMLRLIVSSQIDRQRRLRLGFGFNLEF